jgi:hypothetical protein
MFVVRVGNNSEYEQAMATVTGSGNYVSAGISVSIFVE